MPSLAQHHKCQALTDNVSPECYHLDGERLSIHRDGYITIIPISILFLQVHIGQIVIVVLDNDHIAVLVVVVVIVV